MSQKQTGRPKVMTATTVQKLETALRDGFSIEMACHVSGISRSTYYAYLQTDAEFSDKMTLSQSWATERARQVVIQAIDKGDVIRAQWWLERKARAEFATNLPPVSQTPSPFGDDPERNERIAALFAKTAAAMNDYRTANNKPPLENGLS
jgi:hypothetical protein